MAKILQLSPHIANLIAAGEVVERPASVVKELLENAVDAGATAVTVEISGGGMTFLRVTDNGCGMESRDARTAFLRHATSKLRTAEDLAAISTMGFRGEALAAIASVSRIQLMTKTAGAISGTSLTLEAGSVTEESEIGCPDGTTVIIRDLFFNTPARMKFMKSDVVEGGRVSATVQAQALAHPALALRFIRDGKEILSTPGTGKLRDAVYCVYGRDSANMVEVDSQWEGYRVTGFVCRPTDARPSRAMQTFFVNQRPVKSRLMTTALEEAYRNRMMVGKFPACVLRLDLPANSVDVNVHPAKTEVKFLNEKAVFDCIHYGVLGALNKTSDRPELKFNQPKAVQPAPAVKPQADPEFFRTMTAEAYRGFAEAVKSAPQPSPAATAATAARLEKHTVLRQDITLPQVTAQSVPDSLPLMPLPIKEPEKEIEKEPQQQTIAEAQPAPWRYVGELYRSYLLVEQGEDAFLIDKHAAHERILFDRLKNSREAVSAQSLLTPVSCRLEPKACSILLSNAEMLDTLGYEVDALGENALVIRQIPMELTVSEAQAALESLAAQLLSGRQEDGSTLRDELLHTVACKAAIKAGWKTDEKEILKLIGQVMSSEELKYCPHGRPICISISKKQLEKQFKRS